MVQAVQAGRVAREEWVASEERAVREIAGERAGIKWATAVFKVVPAGAAAIVAPSEAAAVSAAAAPGPAAAVDPPASEVRGEAEAAAVAGEAAAGDAGDNRETGERT